MSKTWVRILLSMLFGGMLQETVYAATGKDIENLFFIGFILFFAISSTIYYVGKAIKNKKINSKKEIADELLDV